MKSVGGAKIPWNTKRFLYSFSDGFLYNFSDDHWLHQMNVKKSNFNFYIYTLFFDHFCVLIVKIRC